MLTKNGALSNPHHTLPKTNPTNNPHISTPNPINITLTLNSHPYANA